MPAESVHTVTGAISPHELGLTLVHEHLLIGYPGWFMDKLAPPFRRAEALSRGVDKLQELRDLGVATLVDPCPMDLGRDVEFMAEVSQRSGVRIVCATGAYKEDQGIAYTLNALPQAEIEAIYTRELTEGIDETGIRAGLIKVATSAHGITPYEHKLLSAAGNVAARLDVPVLTHTDEGTGGVEQLAVLTAGGLSPHRILVGHSDGRDDHDYHRALADRGAYVGFDRFGIEAILSDERRMQSVMRMVEAGYVRSLCLSHDATCAAWLGRPIFDGKHAVSPDLLPKLMPHWEPTHLFVRILPELRRRGLTEAQVQTLFVDNPARYFSGVEPPRAPAVPCESPGDLGAS